MLRINNKLCAWIRIVGIVCALTVILISCRKESSYSTTDYVCNQSSKSLHIEYYKDGIIQKELGINTINDNSCYIVLQSNGFGKSDGPNYINTINSLDSAVVIFDDSTIAVHYGMNVKTINNSRAIIFGDKRNFFDSRNWNYRIVSETKNFKETELKFIFTTQDYLKAKIN